MSLPVDLGGKIGGGGKGNRADTKMLQKKPQMADVQGSIPLPPKMYYTVVVKYECRQ